MAERRDGYSRGCSINQFLGYGSSMLLAHHPLHICLLQKERKKQTLCSWLEGKTAPLCHIKGVNSNCTLSLESLNRIKQLQLWSRPLTLTILIGGSLEKEIYKLGQSKEKPPEVYQVTTKRKEMERIPSKSISPHLSGKCIVKTKQGVTALCFLSFLFVCF